MCSRDLSGERNKNAKIKWRQLKRNNPLLQCFNVTTAGNTLFYRPPDALPPPCWEFDRSAPRLDCEDLSLLPDMLPRPPA
jgi:hypothetical protein